MSPSEEVASYRSRYAVKKMARQAAHEDELRQMQATDGMNELPSPEAPVNSFARHTSMPDAEPKLAEARHLWVIRSEDFPAALEACLWGQTLVAGKIKHSNLTGGGAVHSGGEIWFIGNDGVAINAASGRYGVGSEEELQEIVEALCRSGYRVASMGFDAENVSVPNRVFVGTPLWQDPT